MKESVENLKVSKAIVHQYASDESGILANAYIVELEENLVIVDGTLAISSAQAVKAMADDLGKPLAAIIVTHGHPDHYNGLGTIASEDTPIYSTQGVYDVIAEYDAAKEEQWKPMFGDDWPMNRVFPNHQVAGGETVEVEGVVFQVIELGPGESHSDSCWTMTDAEGKSAFIGDVVLNDVHAYMSDGHHKEWLANIAKVRTMLKDAKKLYPGHGAPGGLEILDWEESYIKTYVSNVKDLLGDKEALSEADKEVLVAKMIEYLPEGGLQFMIAMGADAVVSQLKNL